MDSNFRSLLFLSILVAVVVFFLSGCALKNEPPTIHFFASPTRGTEPLEVTLDASSSTDPDGELISYNWKFGDGSTGSGSFVKHTYDRTGEFIVEVTVTDDGGKMDTNTAVILVKPANELPDAVFTADHFSGEAPLEVSFDASDSTAPDGSIETYSWDFDDGATGSGMKISHTFNQGTFSVELEITDEDGNTDISSATIDVTEPNSESTVASFTANPTDGAAPLDVAFDASDSFDPDGSIETYSWDFGNGVTDAGELASNTFYSGGEYVVTLTVTDDEGEEHTATETIVVEDGTGCFHR